MVVGLLGLVYVTNQAYASRVTAPLQIVEVSGGGGGSPEGTPGSTEKIDVPGADAGGLRLEQRGGGGRLRGALGAGEPPAPCSTPSPRPARGWPRSTSAR